MVHVAYQQVSLFGISVVTMIASCSLRTHVAPAPEILCFAPLSVAMKQAASLVTCILQGKSGDVFNKLGTFAWLAGAILGAELLNVAKLGRGEFTAPFPDHIKLAWSIVGAAFVVFLAVWQASIWGSSYVSKASPPGVLKTKKGK